MRAEGLLARFERIAEAPEGVERLRGFVLDLAVRGWLVEQDEGDEDASVYLEEIRTVKKILIAERRIRGANKVEYSSSENVFNIPDRWVWATINDVGIVQGGKRLPAGATFSPVKTPHIYIRVVDMKNGTILKDNIKYITPEIHSRISSYTINKEDLYITIAGTIGQIGRVPAFFDGHNLTENAAKIVFRGLNPDYFRIALTSDFTQDQFHEKTKQMAQPKLALKRILGVKFPLPPLNEQHRIVAKVDELMALCDELAAAQTRRENRRNRLVAATLHSMNNGDGGEDFRENARFYFNHLPRLTARVEHVEELRRAIINLAVKGRILPQRSGDNPAIGLIEQLKEIENTIVRRKKIKNTKKIEMPFSLPDGWEWINLHEIGITQTGNTPSKEKPEYFGNYIPFIKPGDLTANGIDYKNEGISQIGLEYARLISAGSVLMVCIGSSIGKVDRTDRDICCNQQINTITPFIPDCSAFLAVSLKADYLQRLIIENAGAGTLPIISKGKWERLPIPLPPLREQHRIVAKVDELMALCNDLETHLKNNETTATRLLEATLHEAISA